MSHHQYPTELHTVCDVVRWAMSEMERFDVTLGHGTADYWEEATFLVLRTLKLPFDRLEAFWNAHLTQDELWEVLKNIESRVHNKVPAPYLVHEAWLTEHPFYVDERVLIPRSYIAELLEEGLEPWVEPENIHTVLDMCTAAVALRSSRRGFPEAQVTAPTSVPMHSKSPKSTARNMALTTIWNSFKPTFSRIWGNVSSISSSPIHPT